MIVKSNKKVVKAKTLKKNVIIIRPIKVTKAKGKLKYKIVGGKAKKVLKINSKTGKITVKKRTKKGVYKLKVRITATGNVAYKAGHKTIVVTVKVRGTKYLPGIVFDRNY